MPIRRPVSLRWGTTAPSIRTATVRRRSALGLRVITRPAAKASRFSIRVARSGRIDVVEDCVNAQRSWIGTLTGSEELVAPWVPSDSPDYPSGEFGVAQAGAKGSCDPVTKGREGN